MAVTEEAPTGGPRWPLGLLSAWTPFANTAPLFAHYGVPVWLPELGGESTLRSRHTTN